ncbi:NUDIX hydrolase [Marisediminicola sp. LYQ134]|uniref:NUDIX hydrolase n=1 Tax=Marisediminicola sp. LYQ134 TaxID=3391061 RepID=UPI00398335C9
MPPTMSTVVAAGTVCWRERNGTVLVLVIRRDEHEDVSFPKGKVEARETLPETAVRETREETGLAVTLGASLGSIEYPLPGGRGKVVHFWAAEVTDAARKASDFTPNTEVASIEWLPLAAARSTLTYDHDRGVLDGLAARIERNTARTFAIMALRHGKAVPASTWRGPDASRPLEPLGHDQAASIARAVASFGPRKLVSSTAARCLATIEPVSTLTGLEVKATAAISQDAHEDGDANVERVIDKRLARAVSAVLCSHGPVLPDILDRVGAATGAIGRRALRHASMLDTGDVAVVHVSTSQPHSIVSVETYSPAL